MKIASGSSSLTYRTVATQLAGLPVEIVHKILSDIQVSLILTLISLYPSTYLDECISSHLELKEFLPASYLPEIKQLTTIYLHTSPYKPPCQQTTINALGYDAQTLLQQTPSEVVDGDFICRVIALAIVDALSRFAHMTPALQEYHDKHKTRVIIPPPHTWAATITTNELDYIVSAVTTAIDGLKQEQSGQLLRLAALSREHHYMLKTINDPSQESRSELHRLHLVHNYERLARNATDRWRQPSSCTFSGRLFPLIPYDRYLLLFYKTLNRWPQSTHNYPSQLQVVLDGMKYVYPRDGTPVVLSADTKNTEVPPRWSRICNRRGHRTMNTLRCSKLYDDSKEALDVYRPWPDAEFEWLQAFIEICRYMAQMQEKWYKTPNKTYTVGDYWGKHLGHEMK